MRSYSHQSFPLMTHQLLNHGLKRTQTKKGYIMKFTMTNLSERLKWRIILSEDIGVSQNMNFFPNFRKKKRDNIYGYEWVISKETSTFYKDDEVIATRIITFDKQGKIVGKEKTGSTVMVSIIRFLSQFYNVQPPEDV